MEYNGTISDLKSALNSLSSEWAYYPDEKYHRLKVNGYGGVKYFEQTKAIRLYSNKGNLKELRIKVYKLLTPMEKFKIKFEDYNKPRVKVVQIVDSWEEAIAVQIMLSSIATQKNWTRHSSCTSIVRHMDIIFDLYNEGCVVVEPLPKS